jgi:hypothetical protein
MSIRLLLLGLNLFVIFTVGIELSVLRHRTTTPTPIPIDPNVMMVVFPNLDCFDIESPFDGPTWNTITIGASTIDDLRNYVTELNPTYSEHSVDSLRYVSFSVTNQIAESNSIPTVIAACLDSGSKIVTALGVLNPFAESYLQDLVTHFGIPEFVWWDEILSSRVVVWVTKGIAASVSVDESEQFIPYGNVTRLVYFPYQTLEDYEEQWPYTHRASPRPNLVTRTPELPYVDNPFDFDAMIATITALPSQTATPEA